MNKRDVVALVAEKTGQTKKSVAVTVDALLEVITQSVNNGEGVSFSGFGSFYQRRVPERTMLGIDGKPHTIRGGAKLAFRSSKGAQAEDVINE